LANKYQIVTAQPEHLCDICTRVRQADVDEFAAQGVTVESAMHTGLQISTYTWAGLRDGKVICVFGVASPSVLSGEGVPWMIGSHDLDKCAKGFLPRSRVVLNHMLDLYPHLENYVDARNTRAIRWLRWLGFKIHDAQPYGKMGLPFHRFEMWR